MDDTVHPITVAIAWYHAIIGLGGILAIFGTYHRIWIAPEKERRETVNKRLTDLETRMTLAERDLKSGDKKFDDMAADIKAIKKAVEGLRVALAGSVFKGVGIKNGEME